MDFCEEAPEVNGLNHGTTETRGHEVAWFFLYHFEGMTECLNHGGRESTEVYKALSSYPSPTKKDGAVVLSQTFGLSHQ